MFKTIAEVAQMPIGEAFTGPALQDVADLINGAYASVPASEVIQQSSGLPKWIKYTLYVICGLFLIRVVVGFLVLGGSLLSSFAEGITSGAYEPKK